MRYYCNICKKDITKGEYFYSMDVFSRALCREHQEVERRNQGRALQSDGQVVDLSELKSFETTRGWKSIGKKKRIQIRNWGESILRRMSMYQLQQLCFEKGLSTSRRESGGSWGFKFKRVKYSKGDLVKILLKKRTPLHDIISFATRKHIAVRDILVDIDRTIASWEVKELAGRIKENGSNMLLELEKAIREFVPMRQYDKELYYQDTLATFLQARFPDAKIEVPRGSTRTDIAVNGIAIEVKGPTNDRDLKSIADKCLRYEQYFPNGLICVLFSVNVTRHRYEDWLKGMKKHYPEVVVIRKN